MLQSYIAADAKPTVDNYNHLNQGILPKGIYSGGAVYQGPGRQVTIEAFSAKAMDGFTIVGDTQNIGIPASPKQSWALVLYAKSWMPGDAPPKSHQMEFRVIPWVGVGLQTGYTDINKDPDFPYFILFAKIDALSSEVRILPTEINTTFSDRVNLLNLSSTQLVVGSESFNGPSGTVVFHGLGHTNYKVQITPSEAPNVGIGDIWTIKDSKFFTVYTNGSTTTQFDWAVSTSQSSLGLDAQTSFGSKFGKALLVDPVSIIHSEDSFNYIMLASNFGTQEPLKVFPYVLQENNKGTIVGSGILTPIVWQLVSGHNRLSMMVDSFTMTSNLGEYLYNVNVDSSSLRVFAYPEAAYINPVLTVSNYNNKVKISLSAQVNDGTVVRFAIFKNPGAFPNGSATGTTTIEVVHNLNLDQYVPFISFTNIVGGDLTGYNIDIGRNSFKILLPTGISASFNWLVVPSFTS